MSNQRPYVLTIAGFDPSGGAGLLADIKTFEAHKVYGFAVNTAQTYQNDIDLVDLNWISAGDIIKQLTILLKRFEIKYIKIGIIQNLDVLYLIVDALQNRTNSDLTIIWDPILRSSSGFLFHESISKTKLYDLMKKITLITPNYNEASILFQDIDFYNNDLCNHISENQICPVLIKGGHGKSDNANDILYTKNEKLIFEGTKYIEYSKHGTGCVLSASILSNLANQKPLAKACKNAKNYTEKYLLSNSSYLGYHIN